MSNNKLAMLIIEILIILYKYTSEGELIVCFTDVFIPLHLCSIIRGNSLAPRNCETQSLHPKPTKICFYLLCIFFDIDMVHSFTSHFPIHGHLIVM